MAGTARKARKGRKKERSRNDFSPPGDFVRLLLLDFAREAGVPKLLSELFDLFLGHILAQDDCRIAAESFERILVNLDIRCFFRIFQFNGDLLLLGALKGKCETDLNFTDVVKTVMLEAGDLKDWKAELIEVNSENVNSI